MLPAVPALSVTDALVNHGLDFSDLLAPQGTLGSVVSVVSSPDNLTIAGQSIGDGKRTGCVAQFQLSPTAVGVCTVTASVVDSSGETLSRSISVPVLEAV
jgi:hypothetical protein